MNNYYNSHILHVDDDINQLMFTKIFLQEYDPLMNIESFSDPSKALCALFSTDYDCVVSDFQMDEMDGITLTTKVRSKSSIPVIIYTGRGCEEVEEMARVAGAFCYVQKVMDPNHYKYLYAQICSAIQEKRLQL